MVNTKTKKCPKCGKLIWQLSNHCRKCANIGIHNNKGKNNPNYKTGISLKKYYCLDCGKKLSSYQAKQCRKCSLKKMWNNPELRKLISSYRKGKKFPGTGVSRPGNLNPNWKGGYTFKSYPLGWNKTFKEQIRYRDNYKCQECGCHEIECSRKLHVHHIDYNKKNIKLENLISLCHPCHAKTTATKESKKKFWINYYLEKIKWLSRR